MNMTNVAVVPSRANRVRALAASEPELRDIEIARRLGMHLHEVQVALARRRTFQPKSSAK